MNKTLLRWGLILLAGVAIWFAPVPNGVKPQAWQLFAIFVSTILGFILQPVPIGIIAFVSVTFAALLGILKPAQALSGFSNGVIWLIVSAFLFSRAFVKSGLGRRIAYVTMRAIGNRTLNMAYALAISDLIISPATPSVTARSGGIVFPIAKSLSVAFDSEPGPSSRRMGAYLIQSVTHVSMITSTMFLTSQAGNPLVAALALKALNVNIDWMTWFKLAFVPGIICMAIMPYLLYKLYPPEIKETPQAKEIAAAELAKMGPMSRAEKILSFVFVLVLALWATGNWTKIDATIVGMVGVSIMLVTKVLDWQDVLGEKSAWDTMIWMGVTIALAGFLNSMGLIPWFSKTMASSIGGMSWVATLGIILLIYMYSQYAFAGLSAHITAMFPGLAAVAIAAGAPPILTVIVMGAVSSLCGCLTHYASGPSPIFYGAGYTNMKEWWQIGFIVSLFHMTVWLSLGAIWWKVLGLW